MVQNGSLQLHNVKRLDLGVKWERKTQNDKLLIDVEYNGDSSDEDNEGQ